jgi:hypothetical protein
MLTNQIEDLLEKYGHIRCLNFKQRNQTILKGCHSFRFRVVLIDRQNKQLIRKKGFYYTADTDTCQGALFTACFGSEFDFYPIYVKIYQYINRHEIEPLTPDQLYHSSSTIYDDGLYYRLIAEGTVEDFQKEIIEFLEKGIKKHPELI